jgi:anti-sigma-K factor RskA
VTRLDRPETLPELTCEEVSELAGLYVLDALEPDEREHVREHVATCSQAHAEIRELGGVVPAISVMAPPVESPRELKSRVLAAIAAEPRPVGARRTAEAPIDEGEAVSPRRPVFAERAPRPVARGVWRPPVWASWGAAIAAVLVLAVVGVWALGLQGRADQAARRDAIVSEAIAAFSQPGSSVAVIRPSGTGTTAGNGFAAVTAEETAYLVMVGLPQAPAGQTYQAWFIRDNQPTSAGLMTVDDDGYAVIANTNPLAGVQVVALTVEPAGGSDQPTSDPFALGEVRSVS